MNKHFTKIATRVALLLVAAVTVIGCNPKGDTPKPSLNSIMVISEGSFGSSTAEITAYEPNAKTAVQGVFATANGGSALGDSPTQGVLYNEKVFITLSGSGKIYAINPDTYVLENKITGLSSPRYIEFLSATKGYITNINEEVINIFNPETLELTGTIALPSGAEQMMVEGDYLYTNLWSFGKSIVKIDTRTDKVVETLEVGIQPKCMVSDRNGDLWVFCDGGGWSGNPIGFEKPSVVRIVEVDGKMTIADKVVLPDALDYATKMIINPRRDVLYVVVGNSIYTINVDSKELAPGPILTIADASGIYGIAFNPHNGELYISDAVDYVQNGSIYRYSADGLGEIDRFQSGICPSVFVF